MPKSINEHPYMWQGKDGPYLNTYSGKTFHILAPKKESIVLEDIAHHLSLIVRSVGATISPYSVAQHSLFVCQLVSEQTDDPMIQLKALLHDSEEYITGDWPTPIKQCVPGIRVIAKIIKRAIGEKFNIDLLDMPPIIKHMDNVAMATEKKQLYLPSDVVWHDMPEPDNRMIPKLAYGEVEKLFIDKFCELAVYVP